MAVGVLGLGLIVAVVALLISISTATREPSTFAAAQPSRGLDGTEPRSDEARGTHAPGVASAQNSPSAPRDSRGGQGQGAAAFAADPSALAGAQPVVGTEPVAHALVTGGEHRGARRKRGGGPALPTPVAAATTVVPPAPPPVVASAPGFLTLDTTPWSNVTLDGRPLGPTPLIRVSLPAGTHTLVLSNPDDGLTTQYRVTIRSGELLTRRVGLE